MSTENKKQDFVWTDELVLDFASNARYFTKNSLNNFKDLYREKRSPEYEVLELICNNTAKTTWERNKSFFKDKEEWVKCFLNANIGWAIHSVRRLSDGEVFTLGDSLDRMLDDCPKIDAFLPNHKGNQLWLSTNKEYGYGCALNHATKLPTPKPLFTTEDGVDIYKGDTFYEVNLEKWDILAESEPHKPPYDKYYKYFSNKYNAERYVLLNKPTLSVSDVMDLYQNHSENFETFLSAVSEAAKAKL